MMNDKPIWTAGDKAMLWLNEAEQAQGGANGPTIKLRAAILALVRLVPTGRLPALPEPDHSLDGGTTPFYTAEQMREYALAVLCKDFSEVAADRALRAPPADDPKWAIEALFAIQVEKLLLAKLGRNWTPAGISIESLVDELAARGAAVAPINRPEAACVREGLLLALDYSTSNLIHIDSLYGGYPENGLGRKVKAAREEVAMVRRALAATPPAPKNTTTAKQENP